MASTFSDLKFELIGSGEQSNTWGNTTNVNIGTAIEQAITGLSNPVFAADATLTLALTDLLGPALQVPRALVLNVTSAVPLTVTRDMVVPTIEKQYLVHNNTSGGQSIVVKTAAGTGITVPNGAKAHLYVNGVNVIDAVSHFSALTLGAALPVTSGGTGVTTPALVQGSNVTITGAWPNQTINATSSGDVLGPGSSTDNAIARFNATTGKLLQNSLVTIADNGAITAPDVGSVIPFYYSNQAAFPSASTFHGALAHSHADGAMFFAHGGYWIRLLDVATTVTVEQGGTGVTTSTGTDAVVLSNSPTLVTPNLGTPASGTLTNATGLPIDAGTTGILPVARGGSGTATPALVQGSNITISGSWPNQTISAPAPGAGTVTSVGGTGTVNGISLSGTVTTSGNLTLGGALSGVSLTTQVTGTLPVANGGTGVTASTGTGSNVLSTSPTLVTPALGTPSALVGTNITGTAAGLTAGNVTTNANLTGMITSVGNAASLGSFTSANLAAALTDETGTGANVFANSPTLVTPALGTPASGALTNCTADGTNQVGYRNVPPSGAKTSSYTLVAADLGKFVELGTGGTVVVPGGVFAAGAVVSIFNNTAATISCTCSAVTDVFKAGTDADISSFSITTRGVATILFITATRAVVTGNLA